jgi:hypothetical protein
MASACLTAPHLHFRSVSAQLAASLILVKSKSKAGRSLLKIILHARFYLPSFSLKITLKQKLISWPTYRPSNQGYNKRQHCRPDRRPHHGERLAFNIDGKDLRQPEFACDPQTNICTYKADNDRYKTSSKVISCQRLSD